MTPTFNKQIKGKERCAERRDGSVSGGMSGRDVATSKREREGGREEKEKNRGHDYNAPDCR